MLSQINVRQQGEDIIRSFWVLARQDFKKQDLPVRPVRGDDQFVKG
jgi:hypothetical protein